MTLGFFVITLGFHLHQERLNPESNLSTPTPPASSPEHSVSPSPRSSKTVIVVFGILALLAVVYAGYALFFSSSDEPLITEGVRTRAIQMDVLNAAGENRLALRATEYLRAHGFDVVEMGNALSGTQDHTLVIDRVGNIESARRVATALGVPDHQVVQRIDPTLYLDVTVMIGKDYQSLKPWH
ncbi:MAG: LytR family transcriptional regulator [Ignavibacteria bacterium]|nr:LytR family transcriptional regulator [Ignavibacteria bacterium]